MPIDNGTVALTENIPETMRFSRIVKHQIERKDPKTGIVATVDKLSAQVEELNGAPVRLAFETLAEKLFAQLEPYMNDPNLINRRFTIVKTGNGYRTEYSVKVE